MNKLFAVLAVLFTLSAYGSYPALGNWDPASIADFPDHNEAVENNPGMEAMIKAGERLFSAHFNINDGASRPSATGDSKPTPREPRAIGEFTRASGPDATSCAGCHNQPKAGGSGDYPANVFVGAQFLDPPASAIEAMVTNERNTTNIFGAGAIEALAKEMTLELFRLRDAGLKEAKRTGKDVAVRLSAKGIDFGNIIARKDGSYNTSGLHGCDPDLVIKPFGWKGVAISLREFTIAALNQHNGMQAIERFGWDRTGQTDFDGDGVENEFTIGQVSALVLFQASLQAPSVGDGGNTPAGKAAKAGKALFGKIGCGQCHAAGMRIDNPVFEEPNALNRPGSLIPESGVEILKLPIPAPAKPGGLRRFPDGSIAVDAYTDLKRHKMCDESDRFLCNERIRQDNVPTDEFLTPKLWDLATSAPYCHRGDCSTISEAIIHHAGEGAEARKNFMALPDKGKRDVIAFLLTLGRED